MNKIDCVENYFVGTRAYYLFQIGILENKPEYWDFILDKRNMNGAKVAFISNIMLGIKEDLVDTRGAMDYQSKVFLESLENSVSYIATKVENGYKLGNYIFPDAASLVAIVRNKLAHGKYKIDFEHNRVILEHKGVDIVINIEKLIGFVMLAFRNAIRDVRDVEYERNIAYLVRKTENIVNGKIRNLGDAKKIIKSYNCVRFKIKSLNGMPIFSDCINYLESFIKYFCSNPYDNVFKSEHFNNLVNYLKKRNCKLEIDYHKLDDNEKIDKILNFIKYDLIENDNLTFQQQLMLIGNEVQRAIDDDINCFNTMVSNVHNLILLDAITKTRSADRKVISSYVSANYLDDVRFSYDEFGMILISMFNSLFMYPFDDIFETSGEYKVNRDSSFDFANLDLSMLKPTILNVDEAPLNNALDRCNSLVKKQSEVSQKLIVQQNNLSKVKGKTVAESKINANISDLNNSLALLLMEYMKADSEYNTIKNDYTVNRLHFENRAIIEGIRNAIAHGNYEFKVTGDFYDTEIVFNDIYEGKNTFQLKLSFKDFEDMIDKNYDTVLDYIRNKIKGMSRK